MEASAISLGSAAVRRRSRHRRERAVLGGLFVCAVISIGTTVGIIAALLEGTVDFFSTVSPVDFLTDTTWTPQFSDAHFGILPLVSNTFEVAVLASLIGLPFGLGSAIYLAEYASERVRRVIKPILELLAGVPTVVFGYFALTFVTPKLRSIFPDMQIFNALSASLVVGVMVIPLVSSLSEDAMRAVPRSLREGAYGLGASKFHVASRVVVPAALSGIVASFVLAISRAVGETMVLVVAAGSTPQVGWHPLEPIQTMAAYIAEIAQGDVATGTIAYKTIFAVGTSLFLLTLILNVAANRLVARFRQEYQ